MRGKKRGHGRGRDEDNGFAEWGGYMAAKKAKLQDQFKIDAARESSAGSSQIFHGVAIFVNGYSVPSADELKLLMMKHGGIYHHYYRTDKTTHIIATNLPDTKVKQLKNLNVVKPDWVVDSIAAGRLLDYRQYMLYSRQSKTQPKLTFRQIPDVENKPSTSTATITTNEDNETNSGGKFSSEHTDIMNCLGEESEDSNNSASLFCFQENNKTRQIETSEKKTVTSTSKSSSHNIKTASEVGFLSEFYSNSRLHHISTMGATFKQYVNNLRDKGSGVFPGVEKLKIWKQRQPNTTSPSFNTTKYKSIIMHIDMDCFFVSVGLRKRPDLKGFPVAVTHAKAGGENTSSHRTGVNRKAEFDLYKMRREEKFKATTESNIEVEDVKLGSDWVEANDEFNSMSEIASCNYEARKRGLKNGMFLGQALKLCPNLKTIPYDFEGYKEVSYSLYDTVASYTVDIEAVSCDEMFVDCSSVLNSLGMTPLQLATLLRAEIKEKTGCPCSTGFGSNRLQARLATKRAKPDGQFHLEPAGVWAFMQDINVSDLPGVGRSTSYKLAAMGVKTCLDLQQLPLAKLQTELGVKSGDTLYKHCRGEDTKKLVFGQVRKSVSAEVNYGIRFQNSGEAESFLQELSREVYNRLLEVNMKTKCVTLKLMVKAKDAPAESAKFLGHGVCDLVSRSNSLQTSVSDLDSITREVVSLNRQLNVEPTELRGIGIQLSRLESAKAMKHSGSVIDKFLRPKTEITKTAEQNKKNEIASTRTTQKKEDKGVSSSAIHNFFAVKKHIPNRNKLLSSNIKPAEIDRGVLEALPEEIRREVMQEYGLLPTENGEGMSRDTQPKEPDKPSVYDCGINYSQIDLDVLDELPPEIKEEIQSSIKANKVNLAPKALEVNTNNHQEESSSAITDKREGSKLDRSLPLNEARALIKAWTSSEDCPQSCDINMLADYLEGLVVSRQLESLDICISCLHRCIEKRQSGTWQEAYHTIVNSVQSVMLTVYGIRLHVRKTFLVYVEST